MFRLKFKFDSINPVLFHQKNLMFFVSICIVFVQTPLNFTTHMTSMSIVPFSWATPQLCIYVQNSSTTSTLDVQFQTNPPLQIITNQLKENIIKWWLLYVLRSFLQVGFGFRYQIINFAWLSFDFFSLSWSLTICFFVALYSCVCSCPKYHEISFNYFYL